MALQHGRWISPEEYLEIDRASTDIKYEYVDGHMYAMSGGTINHARIAMNMFRTLDDCLQNRSCRVFSSDMRVQVAEKKYFYPDVTVSCNPEDWQRGKMDIIQMPRLVVEVLSPSAESFDRIQKFRFYRACPSIQEYVLISSEHQEVEIYNRQGDVWAYCSYGSGQDVTLASIDLTVPVEALYRLTDVPEQASEE